MKYLYIGAGILTVLLAACILSTFLISGCTAKTLERLERWQPLTEVTFRQRRSTRIAPKVSGSGIPIFSAQC